MANPFSTNPFRSNPFAADPDEQAPGQVNFTKPTLGNNRRSTNIGPDEVPSSRPMGSTPKYSTPNNRRSTNIGPDEVVNSDNRRSTNVAPDEGGSPFYSAPTTPAWQTPGNRMSNIAPDQVSSGTAWNTPASGPSTLAPSQPPRSPSPSWNTPGNRLSTLSNSSNIAPDQGPPSPTANRSWNSPGNRLSNSSMLSNLAPDQAPRSVSPYKPNQAAGSVSPSWNKSSPGLRSESPAWNAPGNRMSTLSISSNIAPDQGPPSPTAHRSWNTPGNRLSNMSMMSNVAPDEAPPSLSAPPAWKAPPSPAAPPAWNVPAIKLSDMAPAQPPPSQNPFSNPNYESTMFNNRRSTNIGPGEKPVPQVEKPSPVYQTITPADRKSMNSTTIPEEIPTNSPFSKPTYKSPPVDKRRSTNVGPDEVGPSKTAFSRTSYGSPASAANRMSTNVGPEEVEPSKTAFSRTSYGSPASAANRMSTNVGPDEIPTTPAWRNFSSATRKPNIAPSETTSSRPWSTYGFEGKSDNRRSTQVGPDEVTALPVAIPMIPSAGGSFNLGKPPRPTSTANKRTSQNFSKKYSMSDPVPQQANIPETGSLAGPKPVIESPTANRVMLDTPMQTPIKNSFPVDTPMQTPVKSSFADSRIQTPFKSSFPAGVMEIPTDKKGHSASVASETPPKARKSSVAFETPKTTRAGSVAVGGRRPSAAAGHSAAGGRRASTAAGGPRRSSVSVTNVVIPAHLLTHIETNWQEDKVVGRRKSAYQREDTRKAFNIQAMAQKQQEEVKNIINTTPLAPRQLSDSMLALSKADPFAASRKSRGKSLAAVNEKDMLSEEDESGDAPTHLAPFGKFSFNPAGAGDGLSPAAVNDMADPWAAAGAALANTSATSASMNVGASEPPRRRSIWRGSFSGGDPNAPYNGERRGTIIQRAGSVFQDTMRQVKKKVRRSSLWDVMENAKRRQIEIRRKRWVQLVFEYAFYVFLLAVLYFLIIGVPLWKGTYWELYLAFKYKLNATGTWSVVIAVAVAYAYSPLFVLFEPDPPMPEEPIDPNNTLNIADTALMIPCYKAASLIGATLESATKIFPPSHIFVVANGNSPTPLDDTEEVCRPYGVNHIWSPVGSKIVAQFVGCYAAKEFKNVLLIDDDCALPPNFPIVSDRLKGKVMCMGYTIKSVGPNSSKGTLCQQAQDLEYKVSGIQRALAGKIGSATFPHGAISLWDREFLIKTFNKHPGFSVSEDWFFGHVARQLGCRTQMATSVFIETETPPAVFFHSGGARGGFGEMTVFKQRFLRWNFFFVNGMYYNLHYILFSWNLGWWEIGTKLFVFQEIYETLLYLATPIVVPVSLVVRPQFFFELLALTFVLYMLNAIIFNEVHLRRKKEKVPWKCVWLYYMPYKLVLTFVNVASCYWALYKYATYFANRHPKIIEDADAINVVLQLEEEEYEDDDVVLPAGGRRMSVTAVGSQIDVPGGAPGGRRMTITAMGQRFSNPDITITEEDEEEAEELIAKPERKASISLVKTGEAPAPLEGRRPSITVGGRRVSVGAATIIDETPPVAAKTRRSSDAFVSKALSDAAIAAAAPKPSGRRSSDAQQSKGLSAAARRRMSSAKGNSAFMSTTIIQEDEEEEDDEPVLIGASDVQSKRASKRKSQLRKSYTGSIAEAPDSDAPEVPSLDDALMSRITAIEDALNKRGIGAVDFAVHTDNPNILVEENEDEEEDDAVEMTERRPMSRGSSASPTHNNEKKHADAHSMV